MKLKLVVNGCQNPDDYKLLSTTISTVASLRNTAILRFNGERLVLISTPKSSLSNLSTVLQGDTGQLWCTIPGDVFKQYTVISARELNTITMEYNCDYLLSVFKRYDRVMSQGCNSNMTIKLQSMPEWNAVPKSTDLTAVKSNPVCALSISFEEIVHTQGIHENDAYKSGPTPNVMDVFSDSKTVMHSFKVPVKLLFKAQDNKILEPMINYTHIMIDKLPSISSSFGPGFLNFIKRVERYSNVKHMKLSGVRRQNEEINNDQLKIIVNELDWDLEIGWNGPLDAVVQPSINEQATQNTVPPLIRSTSDNRSDLDIHEEGIGQEDESMRIEDSEMADSANVTNCSDGLGVQLVDVSAMVEKAEQESSQLHEVFIRSKDWKVCHKLYSAFEEVILAISHNESCILHCSLDRGSLEDVQETETPRERGQIIYYIVRSKPL